jgi:uncharacterized Zn ribbon protein
MAKKLKNIRLNSPAELQDGDVIVSVRDLEVQFSVRNKILTAIRKISLDIIYQNHMNIIPNKNIIKIF